MDIDAGLAALNQKKAEDLISEAELAQILGRDPKSIKRAVDRQELPPPNRLLGCNVWVVGTIRRHIEESIERASRDVAAASQKVTELAAHRR